jgi:hypothetical protein
LRRRRDSVKGSSDRVKEILIRASGGSHSIKGRGTVTGFLQLYQKPQGGIIFGKELRSLKLELKGQFEGYCSLFVIFGSPLDIVNPLQFYYCHPQVT